MRTVTGCFAMLCMTTHGGRDDNAMGAVTGCFATLSMTMHGNWDDNAIILLQSR